MKIFTLFVLFALLVTTQAHAKYEVQCGLHNSGIELDETRYGGAFYNLLLLSPDGEWHRDQDVLVGIERVGYSATIPVMHKDSGLRSTLTLKTVRAVESPETNSTVIVVDVEIAYVKSESHIIYGEKDFTICSVRIK